MLLTDDFVEGFGAQPVGERRIRRGDIRLRCSLLVSEQVGNRSRS